jgi:molybdenum cofactor cytidylyltransferase
MDKLPIAGIILAAGMSRRFGSIKQLYKVGDSTILSLVVDAAVRSNLDRIVLVLGHEADAVKTCLGRTSSDPRFIAVINPHYREGMSTSLQRGLREVNDGFPSIMVLMGDQPFLGHEVINRVLNSYISSQKDICVPVFNGTRGLPVCFSCKFYNEIYKLNGDTGARQIISDNPGDVLSVDIAESRCMLDIDNEQDLELFKSLIKKN